MENEITVMKSLDSPHCNKLIENFNFGKYICMVIEYCNGGNINIIIINCRNI